MPNNKYFTPNQTIINTIAKTDSEFFELFVHKFKDNHRHIKSGPHKSPNKIHNNTFS